MRGNKTLRQLAVAATLLQHALALPQAGTTADPAPVAWVTVDAAGSAETVTPRVITTQGHRATLSEAPTSIRSTATYTLSPSGRPSTYTGLAPVASATGTDGSLAGVFPACGAEANVGAVEPFCLPKPGSELHPGKTYYSKPPSPRLGDAISTRRQHHPQHQQSTLPSCAPPFPSSHPPSPPAPTHSKTNTNLPPVTWSPSYFPPPHPQNISLQLRYSDITAPSTFGFITPPIPASQGFYPFTLPPTFLSARNNPADFTITFELAYADENTPDENDLNTRVGPTVFVTAAEGEKEGVEEKWRGPDLVTIVLPVVLVGGFLLLSALCFLSWRRTGKVPLLGGVAGKMRRRPGVGGGGGYGVGQSRGERVGGGVAAGGVGAGAAGGSPWGGVGGDNKSETDVGIQLTDRDSWSPTARGAGAGAGAGAAQAGGRNVFREEVERQERLR